MTTRIKFSESIEKVYKFHDYFNYLISEMKRCAIMGFNGIIIVPVSENTEECIGILEYLGFTIEPFDDKLYVKWLTYNKPSYNTDILDYSDILPRKFQELSRTFEEIRNFMTDFEKEAKLTAFVEGKQEYRKKISVDINIELLEDYLDIVYDGDVAIDDDYNVYADWGHLSDETQNNDEVDEKKGEN